MADFSVEKQGDFGVPNVDIEQTLNNKFDPYSGIDLRDDVIQDNVCLRLEAMRPPEGTKNQNGVEYNFIAPHLDGVFRPIDENYTNLIQNGTFETNQGYQVQTAPFWVNGTQNNSILRFFENGAVFEASQRQFSSNISTDFSTGNSLNVSDGYLFQDLENKLQKNKTYKVKFDIKYLASSIPQDYYGAPEGEDRIYFKLGGDHEDSTNIVYLPDNISQFETFTVERTIQVGNLKLIEDNQFYNSKIGLMFYAGENDETGIFEPCFAGSISNVSVSLTDDDDGDDDTNVTEDEFTCDSIINTFDLTNIFEVRAVCADNSTVLMGNSGLDEDIEGEDWFFKSGIDACLYNMKENSSFYFDSDNDKRQALGLFNPVDINVSNDNFTDNIPKLLFQQLVKENFINNGSGRLVKKNEYEIDSLSTDSYKPAGDWTYLGLDGVGINLTDENDPSESRIEQYVQAGFDFSPDPNDSYGYAGWAPYIFPFEVTQNLDWNVQHDTIYGEDATKPIKIPFDWAQWIKSDECYSYGKCLNFSTVGYNYDSETLNDVTNGLLGVVDGNEYRTLNQAQRIYNQYTVTSGEETLNPYSSLEISFWMKTIEAKNDNLENTYVESGIQRELDLNRPYKDEFTLPGIDVDIDDDNVPIFNEVETLYASPMPIDVGGPDVAGIIGLSVGIEDEINETAQYYCEQRGHTRYESFNNLDYGQPLLAYYDVGSDIWNVNPNPSSNKMIDLICVDEVTNTQIVDVNQILLSNLGGTPEGTDTEPVGQNPNLELGMGNRLGMIGFTNLNSAVDYLGEEYKNYYLSDIKIKKLYAAGDLDGKYPNRTSHNREFIEKISIGGQTSAAVMHNNDGSYLKRFDEDFKSWDEYFPAPFANNSNFNSEPLEEDTDYSYNSENGNPSDYVLLSFRNNPIRDYYYDGVVDEDGSDEPLEIWNNLSGVGANPIDGTPGHKFQIRHADESYRPSLNVDDVVTQAGLDLGVYFYTEDFYPGDWTYKFGTYIQFQRYTYGVDTFDYGIADDQGGDQLTVYADLQIVFTEIPEENLPDIDGSFGEFLFDFGTYFTEKNYLSQQGSYNSISSKGNTSVQSFGSMNRFKNSALNKWEKFKYTFNLTKDMIIDDYPQNVESLNFIIQTSGKDSSNGFRGNVLIDNIEVKESYKFTPDVDVRKKKGPNDYGVGDLTKYYDKDLQPDEYNDTTAPLEVQFYFYPRYYLNEVFEEKPITHNDFRQGMFYLYDVDWGDASPKEFTSKPELLGENISVYHTYQTSGIFEITGTMIRMKPNKNYEPLGIIHHEKFKLFINVNEGLDEDFLYFGTEGSSFIPYKNTLPIVGGFGENSLYYKSIKRQLGILTNESSIRTQFKSIGDKLKTEIALDKMDSSFSNDFNVLNEYKKQRFIEIESTDEIQPFETFYADENLVDFPFDGDGDQLVNAPYFATLPFPQYVEEFDIDNLGDDFFNDNQQDLQFGTWASIHYRHDIALMLMFLSYGMSIGQSGIESDSSWGYVYPDYARSWNSLSDIPTFSTEPIISETIYNGVKTNSEELGKTIGDVDITNIRYFDKPKQMYEMLGYETFIEPEAPIPEYNPGVMPVPTLENGSDVWEYDNDDLILQYHLQTVYSVMITGGNGNNGQGEPVSTTISGLYDHHTDCDSHSSCSDLMDVGDLSQWYRLKFTYMGTEIFFGDDAQPIGAVSINLKTGDGDSYPGKWHRIHADDWDRQSGPNGEPPSPYFGTQIDYVSQASTNGVMLQILNAAGIENSDFFEKANCVTADHDNPYDYSKECTVWVLLQPTADGTTPTKHTITLHNGRSNNRTRWNRISLDRADLIPAEEIAPLTEVSNPSSLNYWKNIIPKDYSIFNRGGIAQDNDGNYFLNDLTNEQNWLDNYYYPVLPKYGTDGKFLDDEYPNGNQPFPLNGPITDENYYDSSLKISITTDNADVNVLNDKSGNNNYGFNFSDYKPQFNEETLKPQKVKSIGNTRTSKFKGAF